MINLIQIKRSWLRPMQWFLITGFRKSYSSMSSSHESTKLNKSSSDWLKSGPGSAVIQHLSEKMPFLCRIATVPEGS